MKNIVLKNSKWWRSCEDCAKGFQHRVIYESHILNTLLKMHCTTTPLLFWIETSFYTFLNAKILFFVVITAFRLVLWCNGQEGLLQDSFELPSNEETGNDAVFRDALHNKTTNTKCPPLFFSVFLQIEGEKIMKKNSDLFYSFVVHYFCNDSCNLNYFTSFIYFNFCNISGKSTREIFVKLRGFCASFRF